MEGIARKTEVAGPIRYRARPSRTMQLSIRAVFAATLLGLSLVPPALYIVQLGSPESAVAATVSSRLPAGEPRNFLLKSLEIASSRRSLARRLVSSRRAW